MIRGWLWFFQLYWQTAVEQPWRRLHETERPAWAIMWAGIWLGLLGTWLPLPGTPWPQLLVRLVSIGCAWYVLTSLQRRCEERREALAVLEALEGPPERPETHRLV